MTQTNHNPLNNFPDLGKLFDKMKLQGLISAIHTDEIFQAICVKEVWDNREKVFEMMYDQYQDVGYKRMCELFGKEIVDLLIKVYK